MPHKCIEIECRNEAKHKITTIDGLTLFVCDRHLNLWLDNGAMLSEKISVKVLRALKVYAIHSILFFVGLYFLLETLMTWVNEYDIPYSSLDLWIGFILIITSWIVSLIQLRSKRKKVA